MTVSLLGRGLVLLALFFATLGCLSGWAAGSRRNRAAWRWARNSAYGFSASMIAANFLMVYALVTHDFSVHYVAQVGSRSTPLWVTIVSLWSSLEGSILFWGGVLGLYVALSVWSLGEKYKEYAPWAIHVLLGIAVFFSLLVGSIANPFEPVFPVPPDGPGPNPLLQNHWLMAVHPPMLYLGFVGMSVPYALLCAALLAGRLEAGWMEPVRRWMLIPWMFLTVGIVLGGWWSYAVLGWGGAWAWDPVENASFHPWLTGTAFLHSAMVLQRRGRMRDWTLILGMVTFLLTLLGTFMTRSGVFNSVHSFTQSDIGPVFLGFIAVVLVYSLVLLSFRSHLLDEEAQRADTSLGSRTSAQPSTWLSREFAILVQNALFTAFTFAVLLGTLYPLLAEALQSRRVSVGEPYFDQYALPLGLGLVFMMGVGPALPWGRMAPEVAARRFVAPAIAGFVLAGVFAAMGFTNPIVVVTLWCVGFAFWANLGELLAPTWQRMRDRGESLPRAAWTVATRGRRRLGGHIAHYGILFAVFSLALSKGYRDQRDYTLAAGQAVPFGPYTVTYRGSSLVEEPHRHSVRADLAVTRDGAEVGTFAPRLNYYEGRREPIFTPEVHARPTGDLYFTIIEIQPDGRTAVIRMIHQPYQMWLWWSAPIIAIGAVLAAWPSRDRTARRGSPPGNRE